MAIIIPKKGDKTEWINPFNVDGDTSRYDVPDAQQTDSTQTDGINNSKILTDFIHVPQINLYVAKNRILQNKDWSECHKELQTKDCRMLTIKEFAEFLRYLKANPNGVPNASSQEISAILDEILTIRALWRGEWLDAKFEKKRREMYINHGHELQQNGALKPKYSEQLEDYLTEDRKPGIALDDWINNQSKQGLPRPNIAQGDLYYWFPRENFVARFCADSDWAYLDCNRVPDVRSDALGVRAVRRDAP